MLIDDDDDDDDDDTMHRQFQTRRQSSFIKLYLIVN